MRLKRKITKPNYFELEFQEPEKMELKVVLWIYFKGWIIYPIILFTPLAIAVIEVYTALGLPEGLYNYFIGFAIIYMVIVVWILSGRYELQGLPNDYEKMIK